MTSEAEQTRIMAEAEDLLDRAGRARLEEIDEDLRSLGFEEHGADPAVVEMVHHSCRLFLVITLDGDGRIHGYELLPEEDWRERREKFRW